MAGERRTKILALLASGGTEVAAHRLCSVAREVTDMTGAGLMLMAGDLPGGSACTSNRVSSLLEDLQFELGEGPCIDAFHADRPVLEANLLHPVEARWPAFSGPAIDAGVRAVFSFPLRCGEARLGALNLYRDAPGPLTTDQHADALVLGDVLSRAILLMQAGAPPGRIATELEVGADLHAVVHQATGMVAAQLGVGVGQALVRLRAHAFGNDLPLLEVADAVVARTLRFSDPPMQEELPC